MFLVLPHNKALLIDVCNHFSSKLAGAQDFAKLCELVVDDIRIACISTLTVDAAGEFSRKGVGLKTGKSSSC